MEALIRRPYQGSLIMNAGGLVGGQVPPPAFLGVGYPLPPRLHCFCRGGHSPPPGPSWGVAVPGLRTLLIRPYMALKGLIRTSRAL